MPTYVFGVYSSTPITLDDAPNFVWGFAFEGSGAPDLYAIKIQNTQSGFVEVHVLHGEEYFKTFLVHAVTPIPVDDAGDFAWAVGAFKGSGSPDLYAVKLRRTGSGSTEVHVLDAGTNFQTFLLQKSIPITLTDAPNFVWSVGDFNNDGTPDLYAIKVRNTASGAVEVHVLDGDKDFQDFLAHAVTPVPLADAPNFVFAVNGADVDAIKLRNTASQHLEWQTLEAAGGFTQLTPQTPDDMFVTIGTAGNIAWEAHGVELDYNLRVKVRNTETGFVEVMIGPLATTALLSKYIDVHALNP